MEIGLMEAPALPFSFSSQIKEELEKATKP